MADDDDASEDDGIEDSGAPPDDPRVRVWTPELIAAAESAPPSAAERAHFGIPDAPKPSENYPAHHPTGRRIDDPQPRDTSIVEALVAKFPNFQPTWPEATQAAWFNAFSKLMDAGLK